MNQQDLLKSTLKNRKQRMTAQRELILRIFMDSEGKLMSVDDIFQEIRKKRNQRTSKMTVKRAIDLLVELNLIKEIKFDEETYKYEYLRKEEETDTVIFICENCDAAIKVPVSKDKIREFLKEFDLDFEVKTLSLKLTGYCKSCSAVFEKK
jgi:Fur family ferric uptake transcriptional regulator